ncbi:cation:proton antiporter [Streptomyces sp. NPDC048018]|uniref:cation:proton antiporter domain-containing protein n=1 Tax=Streptomyces sp. NPDC048018 TaxID=3365499 RepID=UPI0037162772
MFCVANLVSAEGAGFGDLLLNALKGAGYATLVGSVVGLLASWLVRTAHAAGWAEPTGLHLAGLALPFLTYAASVLVDGNGFVAAFVAGLWYANTVHVLGTGSLDLVQDVSHLLALAVWYVFGALATEAFQGGRVPQILGYAALVLLVARFVPAVASLAGTDFTRAERAAVGWFGPRGVTSIVFAVLAYIQLAEDEAALILDVTAATVLLSVVVHGASGEPVARWFARHPRPGEPAGPPAPGTAGPEGAPAPPGPA